MNRTKIEWTDWTWNAVTGCFGPGGTAKEPKRCWYCYAEKVANRFRGRMVQILNNDPFFPAFHAERLDQPGKVKKGGKIFVCSMGDLFGEWVPDNWISWVVQVAQSCPQHTFQFLTKNPKRLQEFNPWPWNCWVGCTVTNQLDADERIPWLLEVESRVRFVSHEPLLGAIQVCGLDHSYIRHPERKEPAWDGRGEEGFRHTKAIDWAIIGAMTGVGAIKPRPEWVMSLSEQYQKGDVPIFLKDNLGFKDQPQEWPK